MLFDAHYLPVLHPAAFLGAVLATSRFVYRISCVSYSLFLVEKARSASILGVLISTLASAGLTAATRQLRALIHAAGKKCYTVLVGKPNPAKLANFPEV